MIAKVINQYSYAFAVGFIFILAVVYLIRTGEQKNALLLLSGLLVGFGLVWVIIRPEPGHKTDAQTIREQIGAGRPVLLEFQSPY